jgi:hypothetical protein
MMNWLTALKVLPWGEMIDYAPKLVGGAQKLWQRMKAEKAETDALIIEHAPQSENATARELQGLLQGLEQQLQDMQVQQIELSNLVRELAAQNHRLVGAVDVLRLRTRLFGIVSIVLAVAVIYLFAK